MKATLVVIENDADHAQAMALIEKLMGSNDPADRAHLTAQAWLVEAYEGARWPRWAPSLPDLLTYLMGPAWSFACRSCTAFGNTKPGERAVD